MTACARGVAWDGEAVWATLSESRRAVRLDPQTGKEISAVSLPPDGQLSGLAFTRQGGAPALWQAAVDSGTLHEIDPSSGEVRRSLSVAEEGWSVRGVCTDGAAGPTIWFVEASGSEQGEACRAGRIDVRDGKVHKRIVLDPDASGIDWDGRWLWVGRHDKKRMHRIDPMFADTTLSLELEFSPLGVAFDGGGLWVADRHAPRLLRLAWPGV